MMFSTAFLHFLIQIFSHPLPFGFRKSGLKERKVQEDSDLKEDIIQTMKMDGKSLSNLRKL